MSQHLRKILILALGGEGGGTLTEWVVEACLAHGWPNLATSIPGVAQRTGATSYYIECLPQAAPVTVPPMCLAPMPGDLDLIISSELLETVRAVERGLSSPQRTQIITSSARALTVDERSAMGEGRWSPEVLTNTLKPLARSLLLTDLGALARQEGTIVSAVMFGALVASGVLPFQRDLCEKVIAGGTADARSQASLRGFAAGYQAVVQGAVGAGTAPDTQRKALTLAQVQRLGEARLVDFQDQAYALRYRSILEGFKARDREPYAATQEAARCLARWMAYEDVIRVADLKSRRSRFEQIRKDYKARDGEPVIVRDFLKPRGEEIAAILPPALAGRVLRWSTRRGEAGGKGMQMKTSSIRGLLAMRLLAAMRFMRRSSSRFLAEQALIDRWVRVMHAALDKDATLALSVAGLPELIKGYGDTFARGQGAFKHILQTLLEPSLGLATAPVVTPAGPASVVDLADLAARCDAAIRAALADPDGEPLRQQLGLPKPAAREQTLHFMRPSGRSLPQQAGASESDVRPG